MIKLSKNLVELRLINKTIDTEIQVEGQDITSVYIEDCIFKENLQLRRNNIQNLVMKNVSFEKGKSLSFEISYSNIENLVIENCNFDIFWESDSVIKNNTIIGLKYNEKY